MPNFAIVNGTNISNIIVADDIETANEIAVKSGMGQFAVQISKDPNSPTYGWNWDGAKFVEPVTTTDS